jgi:hypothetical protein
VPAYSPTKIVTTIKGIVSRKVFEGHPEVKKQLRGGEVITNYVKSQGKEGGNKQIQKKRLELF